MFGQIGRRSAHEAFELELGIVLALAMATGAITLFVLANPFSNDAPASSSSASTLVMPGHGAVMPNQVMMHAAKGQFVVAIGDYWFKPSTSRLRAGVYTFRAHNYGVESHDVMIERMPIKFSSPGMPIDEAAPYGLDGMDPGMTKSTKIGLTAGRWELFCSVPGHYMSGQHHMITVYGHMPRGMHMPKTGMDPDDMGAGHMDDSAGMGSGEMGSGMGMS